MRTLIILLAMISLASFSANASSLEKGFKDYGNSVSRDIGELAVALSDTTPYVMASKTKWYMDAIWLKFNATVGISIPGVVGLSLIPSIEFFLKRKLPAGYEADKP